MKRVRINASIAMGTILTHSHILLMDWIMMKFYTRNAMIVIRLLQISKTNDIIKYNIFMFKQS